MTKQGYWGRKKKKENGNKQETKPPKQTTSTGTKRRRCCGGGCVGFIFFLSALICGIALFYESTDFHKNLDYVLRLHAGDEVVDAVYLKASDVWESVKPYAMLVQEKGTELFNKGRELFYRAREG